MLNEILVPYTFRHHYAKASHSAGIPLTNIAAAMGHTTEVHHQSYARFIPDGTADLYAKQNTMVEYIWERESTCLNTLLL